MASDDVDPPPVADPIEEWALNFLTVLFYAPVALGSLVYLRMIGGTYGLWRHTLGEAPLRDIGLGVGAGLLVVALSRTLTTFGAGRRLTSGLARMIGAPTLLGTLLLAVASGCGEELLFRAVLQERLGIWVATALFAAAHVPFDRDLWFWPLFALPVGLLFGVLYDTTGAVLAPAVAHVLVNLLNLFWIGRMHRSRGV